MNKTALLILFSILFCGQPTPVEAMDNALLNRIPRAAVVGTAAVFHQVTSRPAFDLFRKHTPEDGIALACAAALFFYLIAECNASFTNRANKHAAFRFLISLIGLIATIFNPCNSRFIVPFIAFLIIAFQRKMTANN